MKEKETKCAAYEAPAVVVIEVEVEKGFASSGIDDVRNGGEF